MDKKYYETDNLSLCPFLQMNGLKYQEVKKKKATNKFVFVFEDDKQIGTDLAMAFLKSREMEYKKYWSFFRNELAKAGSVYKPMVLEHEGLEELKKG